MMDLWIGKIYEKVEKRIKVCFFSALICGMFAHIYAMTNHLYNYDELWHTPTGFGTGVQMGRWGLSILAWVTKVLYNDVYTIPAMNGLISIIMYSALACVVILAFDIKECVYAGIIGALITTFPAVVSRMFYMFTTHYYAIGELIVALATIILIKCKKNVRNNFLSIVLLVFGTSVYQATFVTAECIVFGHLLIDLIKNKYEVKHIIRKCLFYVVYLSMSMILYLVSNKIALSITGLKMDPHGENYDTMGKISGSQVIESVIRCYKSFLKAGFKDVYSMNPNIVTKFAFVFSVIVIVYVCIRVFVGAHALFQKMTVLLMILVIPVAVNLVYVMAVTSGVMYSIMTFDMVFMLIIPISLIEALSRMDATISNIGAGPDKNLRFDVIINRIMVTVLLFSVISYVWFANGNYLALEYTNNHDNAYYQTLMTQIKTVEGYNPDIPIAMIGKPVSDSTFTRQDMIGGTFDIGGKSSTNISEYSSWNIMTRVLGYDPKVRDSDEDEAYFRGLDEVKKMPCYPNSGSISIIDDTIVIKFQEIEDLKN